MGMSLLHFYAIVVKHLYKPSEGELKVVLEKNRK